MLFAACTNDEVRTTQVAEAPQAVAFDTYMPGATRAGQTGVMNTTQLKATGFGVFAVQTSNAKYAATTTTNFMWNQEVTYASDAWSYTPLKYWPNETDIDSQTQPAYSESHHIDRLSFFAYAPYVQDRNGYNGMVEGVGGYLGTPSATEHFAASGNTGIVALSSNSDAVNDPYVWYVMSDIPSKSVDLLWGVAPAGKLDYQSVNPNYHTTTDGPIDEGKPLVDLLKPAKDQKIKFLFKHALARLGVSVVAAIDQIAPGGNLDEKTKIAVEKIVITDNTVGKALHATGRLNLNNTTAGTSLWPTTDDEQLVLTIDKTHELSSEILWDGSPVATITTDFKGVDKTERKAIRTDGLVAKDEAYFMVIPSHKDTKLNVQVTYYVFTQDAKVSGGYTITKNVIDQDVTISNLTNNKAYNLKLILGMTSVKLDAEVADWQVDGSTDVNLPKNND